jgi:hypothetical protein
MRREPLPPARLPRSSRAPTPQPLSFSHSQSLGFGLLSPFLIPLLQTLVHTALSHCCFPFAPTLGPTCSVSLIWLFPATALVASIDLSLCKHKHTQGLPSWPIPTNTTQSSLRSSSAHHTPPVPVASSCPFSMLSLPHCGPSFTRPLVAAPQFFRASRATRSRGIVRSFLCVVIATLWPLLHASFGIHLIRAGNEGDMCYGFMLSSLFLYLLVIVGCFLRININTSVLKNFPLRRSP